MKQQTGLKKDSTSGLVPIILSDITDTHKKSVARVIAKESEGPVKHCKIYDKYVALINKKADEDVEKFLGEEHTFAECEKELKRYQRLVKEITYNTEKVVRIGMFEVHCEELIKTLARRAENIQNKLLERLLNEHFEINRQ